MLWKDFLQDYGKMNLTSSLCHCSPAFQIACEDFDTFILTMIEKAHIYENIPYQTILDDYLRMILQHPPRKEYVYDFHHFRRFYCTDTTATEDIMEIVIRHLMEKGATLRTDWILELDDFRNYNTKGYLIDVFFSHIPEIQNIDWTNVGKFSYRTLQSLLDGQDLRRRLGLEPVHFVPTNIDNLREFYHWSVLTANSILLTKLYLNANLEACSKNGQSFVKTENRSASTISASSCLP